jgi:hypothetical protein
MYDPIKRQRKKYTHLYKYKCKFPYILWLPAFPPDVKGKKKYTGRNKGG